MSAQTQAQKTRRPRAGSGLLQEPVAALKIKPCPFCAAPAEYQALWVYVYKGKQCMPRLDGSAEHGRVGCTQCGARAKTAPPKEAVAAWNTRKSVPL